MYSENIPLMGTIALSKAPWLETTCEACADEVVCYYAEDEDGNEIEVKPLTYTLLPETYEDALRLGQRWFQGDIRYDGHDESPIEIGIEDLYDMR